MLKGTLVFAQSGGPTSVINASACGVFQEAFKHDCITDIFAARYGIDGVLNEDFIDINKIDSEDIELLRYTPASAFGSCRHKLPALTGDLTKYYRILEVFKKYNVRYFFYNGGNDSMDTCNKIAHFMADNNYQCRVMGVPKTVDNDLEGTDHSPGYASCAKYIATSVHEIALDSAVYQKGRVTIIEIMGRDAGWLTASAGLANSTGAGADLIYVPERAFSIEQFAKDSKAILDKKGYCVVALSEGIHDGKGKYILEYDKEATRDSFGHVALGGVSTFLAKTLMSQYGIKTRAVELSLAQRCAAHISSKVDADESYQAGAMAVKYAVEGQTNHMVVIKRISNNPYTAKLEMANLDNIANAVKNLPDNYLNAQGTNITQDFVDYALPLLGGEPQVKYVNGLPKYSNIRPDIKQ